MEKNLIDPMPWIVTDPEPVLATLQEKGYQNRRLVFISGLNIDISPNKDQIFPLTKFVPWAAYIQHGDGRRA